MIRIERNSNLELLRIVSVVLIIAYHYGVHGIYKFDDLSTNINKYFITFLDIGGRYGVGIFVMITGYFMWNKIFKSIRVLKVYTETYYYSVLGFIFFSFIATNEQLVSEMRKTFMPYTQERYWYVTSFITLLLLSPYINKLIQVLGKKEYQGLLAIMIFIWSILQTLITKHFLYSNIIGFVLLYLMGAYLAKYQDSFKKKQKVYLYYAVGSYLVLYLILIIFKLKSSTIPYFNIVYDYYIQQTSFLILFSSFNLMIWSVKRKQFNSNWINNIAGATFAMYLIHDNDMFRFTLWREYLQTPKYQDGWTMYVHLIVSILLIMSFSYVLNYISKKLLLNNIHRNLSKFCEKIDKKITNYIGK